MTIPSPPLAISSSTRLKFLLISVAVNTLIADPP
jgi:hypothetical protein